MESWEKQDKFIRVAYLVSVILRFLLPCFLQNGYVYPDEFFQSTEVMARDILQINSTITWEWNQAFPVRSPVSAFLTSGIPFLMLKFLSKFVDISPFMLLVFPRIYMTLISLLSFDIVVYSISRRLTLNASHGLFVVSTSYVTHVFATRTFSNTMETALFGIILMLFTPPENKWFSGSSKNWSQHAHMPTYRCILIGSLTSLGIFCRQTFLVFALVPYIGYLFGQLKVKRMYIFKIAEQTIFMALAFFITTMAFVLLDSWYYGYLQHGKIVLTIWNFMKYNSLHSHVHGVHPFLTHFLVNLPLLFGPMSALFYSKLGSLLLGRFCSSNHIETKGQDGKDIKKQYKVFFILCIFVPILILSFIPHQEPRFIMPVLLPLVLLFASKVICSPILLMSWCIWYVIGYIFFGVLHQGGVIPSLFHLHQVIHEKVQNSTELYCHHVVYFHTYMPPPHLLAWPCKASINGHKLYIHDLAGRSQESFYQVISKIKSEYCIKNRNMVSLDHKNLQFKHVSFCNF